jgi:NACHT domain
MTLTPSTLRQYHIFLASPGDVDKERQNVRQFFDRYNRTVAQLWGVRFEVVDWENYASVGLGRPQQLITEQTLSRFQSSLALVIGIMAQRFGSPTGESESGTEEEFRWALAHHRQYGFPEVKWFFRRIDRFVAPPDAAAITHAADQWKRVISFREELKAIPLYFAEYQSNESFKEVLENDLGRWLSDADRPWVADTPRRTGLTRSGINPPDAYYETLERHFHRLDIAGIDNDRAFEIPLSEIYVRLRVMFDEDSRQDFGEVSDAEAIDIQTALLRYSKLVIVGDPGSGKSTFLKYIALMLARSVLQNNPSIAIEKLCMEEPLPIPIFVSCWELSDFLRERNNADLSALLDFLVDRLTKHGFRINSAELESLLSSGHCCLLFDGLDEIPTDAGRGMVSRLLEYCVRRFSRNRYVITSRVRAYTGDTILKGEFARCDIQPFNIHDRAQFLKNWIALLFRIGPDNVLVDGTDANREFQSLTGIETNDRIRPLAVNPLLLTVIAIVHWNRKRLPEQRVDLYDECVDVLLGQRKEAEYVQVGRVGAFDERAEQRQEEERPWLRKRFAEIALRILEGEANREEVSKSDIVKLLAPRFLDRGATNLEAAEIQAAHFLEKQEVRSGLLVSRREYSYRFVHLTFQEYLAAWHLSNKEFDLVPRVIEPRLRQQRWFEPLQLLGGEWAKQSDEKLDRYLEWLLDRQGQTIIERAPVVALCANIVRDTSGVAELTQKTRKRFRAAVEDTLDAFRPKSGVPVLTQLEILEALGQLGAAVKSHLIDATKSGLNQVRARAIEMLLPHLSDDELFEMGHLLNDRSKEPIKTYFRCMLSRDPHRTASWLNQQEKFSEKATEGFADTLPDFSQRLTKDLLSQVTRSVFEKGRSYYAWEWNSRYRLLKRLADDDLMLTSATNDREASVRVHSLKHIVATKPQEADTWQLVRDVLVLDKNSRVRQEALAMLIKGRAHQSTTWSLIRQIAIEDEDNQVQMKALELLVKGRKDSSQTWDIVRQCVEHTDKFVRSEALGLLAKHKDHPSSWKLISNAAISDEESYVRKAAFVEILNHPSVREEASTLFSTQLVWWVVDFDPGTDRITHKKMADKASQLRLNGSEMRRRFEALAYKLRSEFDIEMKLDWLEMPRD